MFFLRLVPISGTFIKKNLLMLDAENIKIQFWIDKLLSLGKNAFSLEILEIELPNYTSIAIKRVLARLSSKGKILSIMKGYYLIITPQYASKGILPPPLYIDGLMNYLSRPYYVGLLSAAAYHGASHQQPQEFFVFTLTPALRPISKRGQKINYTSIIEINPNFLVDIKTEMGYLKVSNPLLTATDLIQFEKKIGGLNRATTVLEELTETITNEQLTDDILNYVPVTTWQRLGFIWEEILNEKELADVLFEKLILNNKKKYRIPLKASKNTRNFSSVNRWNVIVNTSIETDF